MTETLPREATELSKRKTHQIGERPPFDCVALVLQAGGALGVWRIFSTYYSKEDVLEQRRRRRSERMAPFGTSSPVPKPAKRKLHVRAEQ